MKTDSELWWAQKHRPRTIAECILPTTLKSVFQGMVDQGSITNHIFHGRAGVGKTTVALALADQLGYETLVLNGSGEDRGIDAIKSKVVRFASSMSMDGSRKVVIINEADNLTHDAQLALRAVIEDVSSNCSFLLTANYFRKIEDALISRCEPIDFSVPDGERDALLFAMFKRSKEILETEGVSFDPVALKDVIVAHFPDFRRTLGALQKLSRTGKIDLAAVNDTTAGSMDQLVEALKKKDMKSINSWVATTSMNVQSVGRWIDDNPDLFVDETSYAQAIVEAHDHDYRSAFAVDNQITLKSLLIKICARCKLK